MIQYLLRSHGLYVAVNGQFGVKTERQVRRFQTSQKLRVTGKVDKQTWEHLIITLRKGDHGDAVRAVQAALQEYDEHLPQDGRFGMRTAQSLQAFQRLKHLPINNTVGPMTWQSLTNSVAD